MADHFKYCSTLNHRKNTMNNLKTFLIVAFVVVVGATVAKSQDPAMIRDCARTACSSMRSCTTSVAPLVHVQKSGQGTQQVQTDCRQGTSDDYNDCVGLQLGAVKPNDVNGKSSHKKSAVTTPKTSSLRTTNTNSNR